MFFFLNRIRPDLGFVSPIRSDPIQVLSVRSDPIRSDPGFVSPIRSGPIRSYPAFVNGPENINNSSHNFKPVTVFAAVCCGLHDRNMKV